MWRKDAAFEYSLDKRKKIIANTICSRPWRNVLVHPSLPQWKGGGGGVGVKKARGGGGGGVVMKQERSVIVRWRHFIPFKFCYL